ncbi:mavicyanin [Brachypodium distachyon]|uniref:Phytocyanin domain-containing protein n=1 Tax=Brachypodium distachyon TaxID=15368 RepID=I1HZ63_BRADI|nr:mavicyanin [Brachypodium distachyon]KQJ94206.1 hypothetical protein BRADI_3g09220v3 [Brachypodium distachyon]|eukprot:XP_010234087.1 mavicyanin [Brachypodium distachyon]
MAAMRIALLALAAMAVLGTASAATYNVGEPGGAWDLRTDYGNWASSKKFHPGDTIVFKYSPAQHDVLEVSKADYDSCNTNSPISTLTTGNDVVSLTSTGTRYFICGFPGHCTTSGTGLMKVKIDVTPGSSSNSPAPAAGPGASNSPPPPPSSAATSVGPTAGFGFAVVLLACLVA